MPDDIDPWAGLPPCQDGANSGVLEWDWDRIREWNMQAADHYINHQVSLNIPFCC